MVSVTPIPCLVDNYAYLVRREGSREAVVVDACEAEPVETELRKQGLRLAAILTTHHHHDHVGGNRSLAAKWGAPVYGSAFDRARIPGLTHALDDAEVFEVAGMAFCALAMPGHTKGAFCYAFEGTAFTGDTLFCAGCGRLFEGTPAEMHGSLARLATLAGETRVYTGHEYTLGNLEFSANILPGDAAIRARLAAVRAGRARGEFMASATIGEERATNLFLRVGELGLRTALGLAAEASDVEVFAELRLLKNRA